ncbi:urease accessory protein F UreF [Halosimplex carlsbadense 2-9-1]|uniref:Urease accessory protein F UreF n=1 Tax=Halosimplex carlsbadense 2-9-1 TaxID=797114 RepID=M0D2G6_9EURY|nr:urease accessory UreF family protein [Halosimplex carlsbadense]ELZ29640.1 urease accessory protein F UreF [Halosimplex carlsbadense 2-9-1]
MSDEATLESLRLADSFLPVGTDSVSYALEQFVADDGVTDADELGDLVGTVLRRQHGHADLVALRAAHAAAGEGDLTGVERADRRLTAVTLAAEFRESSERTGDRLLTLQRDLRDDDLLTEYGEAVDAGDAPGNYAVVLGTVAALAGVSVREACLLACHEFATAQLGAAQRLMRLGSTEVQRVLDELRPAMVDAVEASAERDIDDMAPFAPLVDVRSAEHERAQRRLFLS